MLGALISVERKHDFHHSYNSQARPQAYILAPFAFLAEDNVWTGGVLQGSNESVVS